MSLNKTLSTAVIFASTAFFSAGSFAAATTQGVIASVDALNNVISVEARNGKLKQFSINDNSRVIIEGSAASIHELQAGQSVKISLPEPALEPTISGEIVAINHDNYTAKIKDQKTRRVVTVSLAATHVMGEVDSVAALTKGHLVTVRLK